MERNLAVLRQSAQRVTADLHVALGDGWTCVVDESFVLTVLGPEQSESALLDSEVSDIFASRGPVTAAQRSADLEEDADDIVMSEALEILRALGVPRPTCPQHGAELSSCSSVWVCPTGHDGPFIGDLAREWSIGPDAS